MAIGYGGIVYIILGRFEEYIATMRLEECISIYHW